MLLPRALQPLSQAYWPRRLIANSSAHRRDLRLLAQRARAPPPVVRRHPHHPRTRPDCACGAPGRGHATVRWAGRSCVAGTERSGSAIPTGNRGDGVPPGPAHGRRCRPDRIDSPGSDPSTPRPRAHEDRSAAAPGHSASDGGWAFSLPMRTRLSSCGWLMHRADQRQVFAGKHTGKKGVVGCLPIREFLPCI